MKPQETTDKTTLDETVEERYVAVPDTVPASYMLQYVIEENEYPRTLYFNERLTRDALYERIVSANGKVPPVLLDREDWENRSVEVPDFVQVKLVRAYDFVAPMATRFFSERTVVPQQSTVFTGILPKQIDQEQK